MKQKTESKREAVARFFLGSSLTEKLRNYIEQAGLDWDPARTVYLSLLLGLIGFNIFWMGYLVDSSSHNMLWLGA